jgi:cytochrome P450
VCAFALPAEQAEELDRFGTGGAEPVRNAGVELGRFVRIRFGPAPVYVLNSPDSVRQALVNEARKLEKGIQFGRAKRLIGNGLVLSDGGFHQRQRRLMRPAFHRAEIVRYTGTIAAA